MDRSDIRMIQWNTRTKIMLYIILAFIYLGGVFIWGLLMDPEASPARVKSSVETWYFSTIALSIRFHLRSVLPGKAFRRRKTSGGRFP